MATAFEVVAELLEQKLGEELLGRAESAARAVSISEDDLAAAILKAARALVDKAPSYARIAHQIAMRPPAASAVTADPAFGGTSGDPVTLQGVPGVAKKDG